MIKECICGAKNCFIPDKHSHTMYAQHVERSEFKSKIYAEELEKDIAYSKKIRQKFGLLKELLQ